MKLFINQYPHQRYNPLSGEWVLVSPQRTQRPWFGQVEKTIPETHPSHDPTCYLCPGNTRADGKINPQYQSTYVFTNDFPALSPSTPIELKKDRATLFRSQPIRGTCRVICFSPRHDLTLPKMNLPAIRSVIDVWSTQTAELGVDYTWVQVFENKGAMMGCSNQHPHGQIWAMDSLPNEPTKEHKNQRTYTIQHGQNLLLDYLEQELKLQERIVYENRDWVALVPYWACWPFETLVLPRRHILRLPDLNNKERDSLADMLKQLLILYDNLFEISFPYSMGWHGAPYFKKDKTKNSKNKKNKSVESMDVNHWQLHAHFYPPLLRSATIKKFMVGFELLAQAQRDLTAEQAAAHLQALPRQHFSKLNSK